MQRRTWPSFSSTAQAELVNSTTALSTSCDGSMETVLDLRLSSTCLFDRILSNTLRTKGRMSPPFNYVLRTLDFLFFPFWLNSLINWINMSEHFICNKWTEREIKAWVKGHRHVIQEDGLWVVFVYLLPSCFLSLYDYISHIYPNRSRCQTWHRLEVSAYVLRLWSE